jgi:putative heme-binding domain-containing protein
MFRWFCSLLFLLVALPLPGDEANEAQRAKDERIVQTVLRLPGFDLNSKSDAKAAVLRHLGRIEGQDKYFEIVDKLNLAADVAADLLKQALASPESNAGVNCASLLLKVDQTAGLKDAIAGKDETAVAAITALGLTGQVKALPLVEPLIGDDQRSAAVRAAAVRALGKIPGGEKQLLQIVEQGRLAKELSFAAANVLLNSADPAVKAEAGKHLTLPATADAKPLPTIAELVKMNGDAAAGQALFAAEKTQCAKCHVVNGQGKEVGPNLSEIGSKLSKEALYLSILDPSAGVSFNYETSQIVTDEGQVLQGIIVSDTAESVTLKTAEAITRVIPKSEIEETTRLKVSLMPQDLQRQLTAQNLVDIVEYLTTLKKK